MQASIPPILVALDLGPSSEHLLRTASLLADALRTQVRIVHALDVHLLHGTETGDRVFRPALDDARNRVAECLGRLMPPHIQVGEPHVVEHVAHRAILEHADAVDAGLILLGPRQIDGSNSGFLGGTADHVLRAARVECLLVNRLLCLPLQRVVVPVNFSAGTARMLETALDWTRRFGVAAARLPGRTEILVVHVMPAVTGSGALPTGYRERARRLTEESRMFLERMQGDAGVRVRATLVEGESPASEICRYAAREAAQLVVMSTHRCGDTGSNVIGTVAMGIVRRASCPVLVVPPRRDGPSSAPVGTNEDEGAGDGVPGHPPPAARGRAPHNRFRKIPTDRSS